jgi:hypothetical protein
MKYTLSQQIFKKILKYQIPWKSAQWEPSYSMRTDRHDVANSRFSQYCEYCEKRLKAIISLNGISFLTETECVDWAVRTEYLRSLYSSGSCSSVNG